MDKFTVLLLTILAIPLLYGLVFAVGWSVGWAIQAWIIGEVVLIGGHITLPVLLGTVACVAQFFRS